MGPKTLNFIIVINTIIALALIHIRIDMHAFALQDFDTSGQAETIKKESDNQEPGTFIQTKEYNARGLRNPFKGFRKKKSEIPSGEVKSAEKQSLPSLTVQGIIYGNNNPMAIINNKVLKKGDVLGGDVKIIDIGPEGIKVLFQDEEYKLPTPKERYLNPKTESAADSGLQNGESD